jgi:hypothetical protein
VDGIGLIGPILSLERDMPRLAAIPRIAIKIAMEWQKLLPLNAC